MSSHAVNLERMRMKGPTAQCVCLVDASGNRTMRPCLSTAVKLHPKVWDVVARSKLHTFEGHEAPVHSVCPHSKEHVHFVFLTSVDGQIKAWLYKMVGSRVNYDAPGLSCTTMVYSADGKRFIDLIPQDVDEVSKQAFRAPIDDTQDLFSYSQTTDAGATRCFWNRKAYAEIDVWFK